MADIDAFPTIRNVLYSGNNLIGGTAALAAKAGQVAVFDATGDGLKFQPGLAEAGERPVGVFLYDAAANAPCTICGPGCIVYVANADDTAAGDTGDWMQTNDCPAGGTVSVVTVAATGAATATLNDNIIGFLVSDLAKAGTALLMVQPQSLTQANSS